MGSRRFIWTQRVVGVSGKAIGTSTSTPNAGVDVKNGSRLPSAAVPSCARVVSLAYSSDLLRKFVANRRFCLRSLRGRRESMRSVNTPLACLLRTGKDPRQRVCCKLLDSRATAGKRFTTPFHPPLWAHRLSTSGTPMAETRIVAQPRIRAGGPSAASKFVH